MVMKTKILIFAFALFMSATCIGQDTLVYKSVFGDSSTMWYIYANQEGFWFYLGGTDAREHISGDTINLEGNTYNIVRHHSEQSRFSLTDFDSYTPILIRENNNHSKLFLRNIAHWGDSEILIMDLNLNVGDTLDTHNWENMLPDVHSVPKIRVDSVFYRNGNKVLRTNLYQYYKVETQADPYDTLFFIEGVGPSFGLYYPTTYFYKYALACHYKDGIANYHGYPYYNLEYNLKEEVCNYGLHIGTNSPNDDKSISIFPNPTYSTFNIQILPTSVYDLTIRDISGRVLINEKNIEGDHTVNIDNLPSGLYYVTIMSEGFKKTEKIVKL